MPTQLVVVTGPDKGRVFPLTAAAALTIGRGGQSQTRLADPAVSRVHCEVQMDGAKAFVTDARSGSGTFVNGKRSTRHRLKSGDVIQIGDTHLRFEQDLDEEKTIPPADAPAKAAHEASAVFANKPGGRLLPKPLADVQALTGKMLGNYQLLSIIGTGQIGVVFHAKDAKDQKAIALKVLRSDFAKDKKAMQRFVRGMMTARALHHPNLVQLLGAGITGPHCWIAMELVDGVSLAQTQKSMPPVPQRGWKFAQRVATDVAKALGYMHERGLIHRSVMPQNILVQKKDSAAKLGDAMLAKALEGSVREEVTTSGELVGNLYYMAPERTAKGAEVDGRSDFFGLGVTLYSLLTGQMPFEGTSIVQVVTRIRQAALQRPRERNASIPEAFEAIVVKLLAKKPADRYANAAELLAALEGLV